VSEYHNFCLAQNIHNKNNETKQNVFSDVIYDTFLTNFIHSYKMYEHFGNLSLKNALTFQNSLKIKYFLTNFMLGKQCCFQIK